MILFGSSGAALAKLMIVAMYIPLGPVAREQQFGPITPGFGFDRAVVSWNVEKVETTQFLIEAKVDSSPWQVVGRWPLSSVPEPLRCHDAKTVTLRIKAAADRGATVRMITVAFEKDGPEGTEPVVHPDDDQGAPDIQGDINKIVGSSPEDRLLAAYLRHWSRTLGRRDLVREPSSLSLLHPANGDSSCMAAAAGSILGFRGYVSFFHSLGDLARWNTMAPVWCDLSGPDGSVLVYGLKPNGDVAAVVPEGNGLGAVTIPQRQFARRWQGTGRRVLILQPKGLDTPEGDKNSPVWIHLHIEPPLPPLEKTKGSGS